MATVSGSHPARSPLRHLDVAAVGEAARIETRNREVHLPPIAAYRWWARRTEAINGAILDAFAEDRPGRLLVVDPFAGGGVIPLAAVVRGHRVYAQELNPWAAMGLAGMLGLAAVTDLAAAEEELSKLARPLLDEAYATRFADGRPASVSYTFRVATADCPACHERLRLFHHALVSLRRRREHGDPAAFLACPAGHLFAGVETGIQKCGVCGRRTDPMASYSAARRVKCHSCGAVHALSALATGGTWAWEPVLVERVFRKRRELSEPTQDEISQASDARWSPQSDLGAIPEGQETAVLLNHGFRAWDDIYPARQRHVLEHLLLLASRVARTEPTLLVLRLAIVGAAEMAGYLSRWDRYYLKSYESMAGHRFNFTTFAAEPNVWGTGAIGRGTVVRRLSSFATAARWLRDHGAGDLKIEGPVSATRRRSTMSGQADVRVVEGSSERMLLLAGVADLCLTDPPFHDDVQYDELSLPLRAWAQQSINGLDNEAVVNGTTGRNANGGEYRRLLTRIFREVHRTLRTDGHLIFSYANREPRAWSAVLAALNAAGFRAAGCAAMHSENETDVVKRDVRACTLDLLMDLVPVECSAVEPWIRPQMPQTDEGRFLGIIGEAFARVESLTEEDLSALERHLGASEFLTTRARRPPTAVAS
jgi:SAM-dependent methyltransferase